MFPHNNLDPSSNPWANAIEQAIMDKEAAQPILEQDLALLQKDAISSLDEVSSRLNNYYTSTRALYPVSERFLAMRDCLGGDSKVVSISAPAAANNTVAENWVSVFTYGVSIPVAKTVVGWRLNNAQFTAAGSSSYELCYRWRVNTVSEGILTTKWMSRNEFNLETYPLSTGGSSTLITNRYVYWTGASGTSFQIELQARIENASDRTLAVPAQNITFRPFNSDGLDTYIDIMVTV